jgi:hypothetical protein
MRCHLQPQILELVAMARTAKVVLIAKTPKAGRKRGRSATTATSPSGRATDKAAKAKVAAKKTAISTSGRKPGRAAMAPAATRSAGKTAKATKVLKASAPVVSAPKLSREELRAQVEKLEATVATLRGKNREANKAAKALTSRVAELEEQITALDKKGTSAAKPIKEPKVANPLAKKVQIRKLMTESAGTPVAVEREPALLEPEAESLAPDDLT